MAWHTIVVFALAALLGMQIGCADCDEMVGAFAECDQTDDPRADDQGTYCSEIIRYCGNYSDLECRSFPEIDGKAICVPQCGEWECGEGDYCTETNDDGEPSGYCVNWDTGIPNE